MPEDLKRDTVADVTVGIVNKESTEATEAGTSLDVAVAPSFRYVLREEIARGGMGEVYLADDRTLGRQVAIKIYKAVTIQDRPRPGGSWTRPGYPSQLQHPGIPPIHDVGTLPDGRPFLAMKLIKGKTLVDLVRERPDPGPTAAVFWPRLSRFVRPSPTPMPDASSTAISSRQNIMVGAFGEVQVMDWGLAKVLGRSTGMARPSDSDGRMASEILSARDDPTDPRPSPAACWARRHTWPPSRPSGPSSRSTSGATSSASARSWQ